MEEGIEEMMCRRVRVFGMWDGKLNDEMRPDETWHCLRVGVCLYV